MRPSPSTASGPRSLRGPLAMTALVTAALLVSGSGLYVVDLPALLFSTAAAAGILLTVSFAVIPAMNAFIDLAMTPEGRPLAMVLGLVALAVIAGLTWAIVQHVKRRRHSSQTSTVNG